MNFTSKARASRLISAGIAVASALSPMVAQANTSTNATQLSITVAPISVSGTTLGAAVNASGVGLTSTNMAPSIAANGALGASATLTAGANTTFNFDITARAADTAPVTTTLSATQGLSNSAFGLQSGLYSDTVDAAGTLSITGTTANVVAGTRIGSTATAIFSTSLGSEVGETGVRRVATSANEQTSFTAERQAAAFQFGGSGLTAVTAGGLAAAVLGASPAITPTAGGETQADVAFVVTKEARTGQAAVAANSTGSTNLVIPAYGEVTATYGGTTAGGIDPSSINAMTVTGGGAGTTSTLSLIQSMTVFQ